MAIKRFLFIRHGKTQSNLERRYTGDLSEPLCDMGIEETKRLRDYSIISEVDWVISGKARRCRQTADILFPNKMAKIVDLVEIDFGIFKGKSADDLKDSKEYQDWVDSYCMADIPQGDSVIEFKEKSCRIFLDILENSKVGTTALVIHGGNIMAIMEEFSLPKKNFYDFHIGNSSYILCEYKEGKLYVLEEGKI